MGIISRKNASSVLIGFTGDVMIGRLVDEMMARKKDPAYIWGDTLPYLKDTDLNIINLEAALTRSEKEVLKTFNFKSQPDHVKALQHASIGVANLANNHCLDYNTDGLFETLEVLDKAGIVRVGAGPNAREAARPAIVTVKGIRIGILGYTDNEPSWKATGAAPGVNYISIKDSKDAQRVERDIANLKEAVDIVVVTIHWGPNMRERPPAHFQTFARSALDSGADIFHGHSAHIFQGIEIYKKKVIFYDTGDFVDDYYVDPVLRNDRSFLFLVEATKDKIVQVRLLPTLIDNCQVNLSSGQDLEETLDRMRALSQEFGTELLRDGDSLTKNLSD